MKIEPSRLKRRGLLATTGIGLLVVAGCVGPALVAAGVLGTLGAVLRSPWLGVAAIITLGAAIAIVVARRQSTRGHDDG